MDYIMDFSSEADAKKLKLNKVLPVAKKIVGAVCPNPNITLTLPNKITLGCR